MRAHDRSSEKQASDRTPRAAEPAGKSPGPAVGGPLSPQAVVALQRAIGNAAVARLLTAQGGHDEPVQRSTVPDVLSQPGTPLSGPLREEMEGRLGADFSDVRLHNDAAAQQSATEVGARAYTSGRHIVTGTGGIDKHTLAHELTHVIQQRSGPVAGTDRGDGLRVSDPGDRFEKEAEATATRAMADASTNGPHRTDAPHEAAASHATAAPAVQRMVGISDKQMNTLCAQDDAKKVYAALLTRLLDETNSLADFKGIKNPQKKAEFPDSLLGNSDPFRLIGELRDEWGTLSSENRRARIENVADSINEYAANFASELGYVARVPVGSEFTFTNNALREVTPANNDSKIVYAAHLPHYEAARKAWRKAVEAIAKQKDNKARGMPKITQEEGKYGEVVDRYTFPAGPLPGGELPSEFHYDVTMDNRVIEVVTSPYTAGGAETGNILAEIFDKYIFGAARMAGLEADDTLGGGHVNLDLASTIGNDSQRLLRFIDAYFEHADYFKEQDSDKTNAPFPDEFDEKTAKKMASEYKGVKKDLQDATKKGQPWDVQRLAKELIQRVFKDNLAGQPALDSPHYQALNLEHVGSQKEKERRLEVRRLPAQRDRYHLIEHLQQIQRLLQHARRGEPIPLRQEHVA
ncbi:DUF4157 domain-containing protein [Saccharopolyspora sp. NPDC050389]|uniref:eCIS core domain-containing protein n=1 Tax=Saccharopolyspora sp. NPDC050389 TaxID=3155516 RepID=UPI0033D8C07C